MPRGRRVLRGSELHSRAAFHMSAYARGGSAALGAVSWTRISNCRFFMASFLLILSFVCGISLNLIQHDATHALAAMLPESYTLHIGRACLSGAAWSLLLTMAVFYGRGGGIRALCAYCACGADGFACGFALSELLYAYGTPGFLLLFALSALSGLVGIVVRMYCFLYAPLDVRANGAPRAYLPLYRALLLSTLAQTVLLPLCIGAYI